MDSIENNKTLEKIEDDIKSTLSEIEKELDCNGLISWIFNPLERGGEIIEGDFKDVGAFIDGIKTKQITLLLHGPGGNFIEGFLITLKLRNKFLTYKTFVPQICSSSLCFPVLKSDGLILLKGGVITQIDPYFEHEGKPIRAIKHLRDEQPVIQEKAKRIFEYAERKIFELITEKPSLFDYKKQEFEKIDKDNIIDAMMNRDEHDDEVRYITFEYIPFKVEFKDSKTLNTLCTKLIQLTQDYLITTGRRYCLCSTYETVLNEGTPQEQKGHLLFCP